MPVTDQMVQQIVIEAIRLSTAEVFTTMLQLDSEVGEAFESRGAPMQAEGVVSLIGLAGPWMGTGSMSCSPLMACRVAGALLMCEFAAVDEEVLDAVAEVTNMIIGNVKTAVEEHVGPMGLSIPTVIFGRNFSTKSAGSNNWSIVPFLCKEETLLIQVCLVKNVAGRSTMRTGFTHPQLAVTS